MTAVVIFAKNEEKIIGQVIDDLKNSLKQIPDLNAKLFLCDDSTDQTAEIAQRRGVTIIPGLGQGLGWSYYLTLCFLSQGLFSSIITIDGDGQTDLSELPYFYKGFKKGCDLIIGSRFLKKGSISYNYSPINFLGVKILSFIITVSAFTKVTDSHGGLRIMSISAAKNINFLGGYSYVQETIISIACRGLKIKELPSKWNQRIYGESRVLHSRLKYIKSMLFPLLLRMRIHWLGFPAGLAFLVYSRNILYIWFIIFCILVEFYTLWVFRKNKLKIKKWLENG